MNVDYNEYICSRKEKISVFLGVLVLSAGAGFLFYSSALPLAAAPFFYRFAEGVYRRYRIRRRKDVFRMEFRDFLSLLSGAFAGGRPMREGILESVPRLDQMHSGRSVITKELQAMVRLMDESGMSESELFIDLAKRTDIEEVKSFAQVYQALRETGGNIIGSMEKIMKMLTEKITIEKEIAVMVSQKKFEGRIIILMPVMILLFLKAMSPSYIQILYESSVGRILMTGVLAAILWAAYVIERITNIQV